MQNATANTTSRPGANIDRIFALGAGGLLVLVGLVFVSQIGILMWLPARVYEATATFRLIPNHPGDAQDGLRSVWSILPSDAAVGLELIEGEPRAYRLLYRSSDPAKAAALANAVVAATQANAARAGAGSFQILHPADVPKESTSPRNRQLRSDLFILLFALVPIVAGLWLAFRRPAAPLDVLPT